MAEVQPKRQTRILLNVPDAWNKLTEEILGCAFEVHSALGPGLVERIYEPALVHELRLRSLQVEQQRTITLVYKGLQLPEQRLDLFVNGLVVVELKSLERVPDVMLATLVSYLRAADAPLGLIINFNVIHLRNGIYRRVNSRATAAKPYRLSPRPSESPRQPLR